MSLKVVLTLVIAFVLVVFGLFNFEVVTINLVGFKKVSLPISILIFFVFLIGAAYSAVLSFQMQIEQALRIKSLKKKVQELKDAASLDDQEVPASGSNWKISSGAKEPLIQQPAGAMANSRKRTPTPQSEISKAMKSAPEDEKTDSPVTLQDDDEDEGGLSSQLREIALRRIKNG